MRASTMFALVVAVLIGLGVTAAAKYAGLFDKPAAPEVKEEEIKVLVAASNLFENTMITANDVRLRALNKSEVEAYKKNEGRYLPAQPSAANFRVLARSVEADQPLLKEHFQDLTVAQSVTERLAAGMRAVDLALPKDRAAGGMLRVGERADVLLTATITTGEKGEYSTTRSAVIARDLKVITKRNNLWQVMQSDPDNKLISYQLEANPYRAALIEFAKQRGTISLVPTPSVETRAPVISTPGAAQSFADSRSKEYRDEDVRVAALNNGELTVGDNDLERIFDVKPVASAAIRPPHRVEMVGGIGSRGFLVYPTTGTPYGVAPGAATSPASGGNIDVNPQSNEPPLAPGMSPPATPRKGGTSFSAPDPKKDCPNCGKDKK